MAPLNNSPGPWGRFLNEPWAHLNLESEDGDRARTNTKKLKFEKISLEQSRIARSELNRWNNKKNVRHDWNRTWLMKSLRIFAEAKYVVSPLKHPTRYLNKSWNEAPPAPPKPNTLPLRRMYRRESMKLWTTSVVNKKHAPKNHRESKPS